MVLRMISDFIVSCANVLDVCSKSSVSLKCAVANVVVDAGAVIR